MTRTDLTRNPQPFLDALLDRNRLPICAECRRPFLPQAPDDTVCRECGEGPEPAGHGVSKEA